jgi:hypothetical protein
MPAASIADRTGHRITQVDAFNSPILITRISSRYRVGLASASRPCAYRLERFQRQRAENMRIASNPFHAVWMTALLIVVGSSKTSAQDLNPAQVARLVAENAEALRNYSWSLRVEATIGGEEQVGLYKVRYDFDGELETTPLDSGAASELADVLQALGDFLRPYARPGAYAMHRFLNNAEIWEGRGNTANTVRIEGEDLHWSGDEVVIAVVDGRPRKLEAQTAFEGSPLQITVDYRDLPNDGPAYPARLIASFTDESLEVQHVNVETFDYIASTGTAVRTFAIPVGTEIAVRSNQPLSSAQNETGQMFEAVLATPIAVEGRTLVAPGSRVVGRILEAQRSGRRSGRGKLTLAVTTLYAETGPLAVETHALTIEAEGTGGRDARRVAGATLLGAVIGGIADGGSGAAIGAAVGAGAGGAVTLSTRGDEVEFPAEQSFTFTLSVPIEVSGR